MTNNISFHIALLVLFFFPALAFALKEECSQSVDFSNKKSYSSLSGMIQCYQKKNPTIKTRQVMLKNGMRHGESIIYEGFSNDAAKSNEMVARESYQLGEKQGSFIVYDLKTKKKIKEVVYEHNKKRREIHVNLKKKVRVVSYFRPNPDYDWDEQIASVIYDDNNRVISKQCPKEKTDISELNKLCNHLFNKKIKQNDYLSKSQIPTISEEEKTYYASGQLKSIYSNHRQQFFYENGQLNKEVIDEGDYVQIIKEYYPNGKKKHFVHLKDRIMLEMRIWYMNEKLRYHAIFNPDINQVKVKTYHGNGQLYEDYRYIPDERFERNQHLLGEARIYYKNGTLFNKLEYNKEGYKVYTEQYDKQGRKRQSTQFHNDGTLTIKHYSQKETLEESITYYPDGSVKEKNKK